MEIEIKGTIVSNDDKILYDWVGIEATCPKDIDTLLREAKGEDLTIKVNSGGGDVFAGNAIYYMIAGYPGKTSVEIMGFAASAATVICCAGQTVKATPGAQYMIHNVSCGASGDYNEMDKTSEILKNANIAISNVYRAKTGMSRNQLLELMNQETWMDATKAKELGFVDEIIGDDSGLLDSDPLIINNSVAKILSAEAKNKIRAQMTKPEKEENRELMENQLTLLKLGGLK